MKRLALALLLALPATAAHAGDWGGVFSAVTLTSDYRFQGVSSTGRQPAMQAYAHYWRPDGWYAGVFASQVDYGYPGSPTYEIDGYAGKNLRLDGGKSELKVEAMYSAFPDNETWGPTLDFLQLKVQGARRMGPLTLTAATAFTPDASYRGGEAWLAETSALYTPRPWLKLKAGLGHRWAERGADRTYWNAGAAATWKTVTFEVRYEATNLSRAECTFRGTDSCAPAVVGALTVALPPIL